MPDTHDYDAERLDTTRRAPTSYSTSGPGWAANLDLLGKAIGLRLEP